MITMGSTFQLNIMNSTWNMELLKRGGRHTHHNQWDCTKIEPHSVD
jgi:hypothetical protein